MNIKLLSVVSALIMSISLSSCGDNSGTAERTDDVSAKKAETWQTTTMTTKTDEIDEIVYESQNFKVHYWGTELNFDNSDNYWNYAGVKLKIDNNSSESTSVYLTPYSTVTINGIDLYADSNLISFTKEKSSDVATIIIKASALKDARVDKDSLKEITFALDFQQSYVEGVRVNEKSVEKTDKITVKV